MPGVEAVYTGADLIADDIGTLPTLLVFKRPDGSPMTAPPRRLLAHETMDPNSEQRGFIRDMFDPIARAVAEALRSALPTRTEAEIWWAYEFMLGAMVYVMGDAGRLERLTDGLCRPDDEAASVPHMVAFLTAGVRYGMPPRVNEGNRHTEQTKVTGGKTNATRDVPKGERIAARRRPR